MSFEFLKHYINRLDENISDSQNKYQLYSLDMKQIEVLDEEFVIPLELKKFYEEIGYGFFNKTESYTIDTLLSPSAMKAINLKEDYYEFDPTLDFYDEAEYRDKIIFFEVVEGNYLLIDKEDKNGKNAIYYFDQKIADSLEEFLIRFDKEGHYFIDEE